jgi:hypothetical protein
LGGGGELDQIYNEVIFLKDVASIYLAPNRDHCCTVLKTLIKY